MDGVAENNPTIFSFGCGFVVYAGIILTPELRTDANPGSIVPVGVRDRTGSSAASARTHPNGVGHGGILLFP